MNETALALGFGGQMLFTGRVAYQWIASERRHRSCIPRGYWAISVVASGLVLTYSVLVRNPVFFLSTVPGAIVAVRNLRITRPLRRLALLPGAIVLAGLAAWGTFVPARPGPAAWAAVGTLGALLWSGRAIAQWWVSERGGASVLPASFWSLSLAGSLLLLAYAWSRRDPVMVLGYGFGCVPYLRNLVLLRRHGFGS